MRTSIDGNRADKETDDYNLKKAELISRLPSREQQQYYELQKGKEDKAKSEMLLDTRLI
jgi:hypothetical protein